MKFEVQHPYDERGRSPDLQLFGQARIKMDQGELETALDLFRQSGNLSAHFKTFELAGECLMRLERFAEAIPFLAAASYLNTGPRAPTLLAESLLQLGRFDKAREVANRILEKDANNKRASKVLALLPARDSSSEVE
jgi:tetratricopeptide (TPR) repeat protein